MKKSNVRKVSAAGILCAVSVVGSMFSFPVLGSKCAPVQHMVNVIAAVLLGPYYAVGTAFAASLIRNLLGTGSIMAFPGSMFGALLCGITARRTKKLFPVLIAEIFGTAILGGLCAYPTAVLFMGVNAADAAFYAYIIPFFISTAAGSILSGIIVFSLRRIGALKIIKDILDKNGRRK